MDEDCGSDSALMRMRKHWPIKLFHSSADQMPRDTRQNSRDVRNPSRSSILLGLEGLHPTCLDQGLSVEQDSIGQHDRY